ncbi:hypothetical protein RvY_04307 [Ramazzottius varieornatus]|uniref:G-protein coupled receptors family 1 profile domain-containing protein n=1 Tax=Ramazzottius varieornatus TaxID=947166 RepID=A0A1D1UR65_RAMVA|nr:hypothetical protein RvY_04307 [Ramazzottius varieornatus]
MTSISIDRYYAITRWATWHLSYARVFRWIAALWVIAFTLIIPPLFGWSRYVIEGIQTSCSFDWLTQEPVEKAYVLYLTVLGFFLPLIVIFVCYVRIIRYVVRHRQVMNTAGFSLEQRQVIQDNDVKAATTCAIIVVLFVLAWGPYTVVALIGIWGDQSLVTPYSNALPVLFCKTSAVYNPVVYALMNERLLQKRVSFTVPLVAIPESPHSGYADVMRERSPPPVEDEDGDVHFPLLH